MAGGAPGGMPTSSTTGTTGQQPQASSASQYSNYGAQPNGAFYGGPNSGAPASGGFPSPAYGQQMNQPPYQQSYQQPQFGGGYGQGYGSPFGGMGGMYGPQPQYGYGGMGNQFMGGGMGGFDPYGGRPARSFGGRDMYGPRGGFDPRMAMQQMYGQQAVAQQAAPQQPQTATAAPGRTEADWNRFAAQAKFAPGTDMEQAKKDWMSQTPPTQSGMPGFGGLGSVNMMTGRPWESRSQRAQVPMQALYQLFGGGYR